jgi:hypothetical protein
LGASNVNLAQFILNRSTKSRHGLRFNCIEQHATHAGGNRDRRRQYTTESYKKGFEMHNSQNDREIEVGNDLQHLKWYDGKSSGHIYYDKPN